MLTSRGGHGLGRHNTIWARPEPTWGPARPGPLSAMWTAGLSRSRNFLFGPHWHEPALAGPWAERSFSLFYLKTVKNTKIQHKTWAGPQEARARPAGLGRGQIFKISSPARHSWVWARPLPTSSYVYKHNESDVLYIPRKNNKLVQGWNSNSKQQDHAQRIEQLHLFATLIWSKSKRRDISDPGSALLLGPVCLKKI